MQPAFEHYPLFSFFFFKSTKTEILKIKATLLTLLSSAIVAVSAAALPDGVQAVDNPLEGYKLIPMEWTGSIKEGADPITLSGTAEEVVAQIQKLNPDYVFPEGNTSEPEIEKRSQVRLQTILLIMKLTNTRTGAILFAKLVDLVLWMYEPPTGREITFAP
ncbi:hypothetical protein ACJA88_003582 [Fusarium oxysporum]